MGETMTFPETVEEFMEQYKIVDREQVYTNGAELVPIFRMKQWFGHLPSAQPEPKEGHWIPHETPDGGEQYECSRCGVLWEFTDGTPEDNEAYFCPKCGMKLITKKIKGEQI